MASGGEVCALSVLRVVTSLRLLLPHFHLRNLPRLPDGGVELVSPVSQRSDITDGVRPPQTRAVPGARPAELHAAAAGGERAGAAEVFLQPAVCVVQRSPAWLVVSHQEGSPGPRPAGSVRLEQQLVVLNPVDFFGLRDVVRSFANLHTQWLRGEGQYSEDSSVKTIVYLSLPDSCGS